LVIGLFRIGVRRVPVEHGAIAAGPAITVLPTPDGKTLTSIVQTACWRPFLLGKEVQLDGDNVTPYSRRDIRFLDQSKGVVEEVDVAGLVEPTHAIRILRVT
jgi:hypothetical protein